MARLRPSLTRFIAGARGSERSYGNLALGYHIGVSTLVTSICWTDFQWQCLKLFDQHWPQPVPPYAVNLIFPFALGIQAARRERAVDLV